MKSNGYFPLFMDISEKKIVVVGGGNIAARRVKTLCDFCGHITVVAPELHPELEKLEQERKITVIRREYKREDIYDAWMVLAATDQHKLNEEIYSVAKCIGALVNVASNQAKCDFHFPGIVRKGSYVVGINASGKDHHGAAVLREKLSKLLEEQAAAGAPDVMKSGDSKELQKDGKSEDNEEVPEGQERSWKA